MAEAFSRATNFARQKQRSDVMRPVFNFAMKNFEYQILPAGLMLKVLVCVVSNIVVISEYPRYSRHL